MDPSIYTRLEALERRLAGVESLERPGPVAAWTPALQGSTTAGVFSYAAAAGTYTRIGPLIVASAEVLLSGITTPAAGVLRVTGLPRQVAASGLRGGVIWLARFWDYSANARELVIYPELGASFATVAETTDAGEANFAVAGNLTASTGLYLMLVYQAA